MAEYIDREAAVKALNDHLNTIPYVNVRMDSMIRRDEIMECRAIVRGVPAAGMVDVVRCKDCVHGKIDDPDFPDAYFCEYSGIDWNRGKHYCSYGKRRADHV